MIVESILVVQGHDDISMTGEFFYLVGVLLPVAAPAACVEQHTSVTAARACGATNARAERNPSAAQRQARRARRRTGRKVVFFIGVSVSFCSVIASEAFHRKGYGGVAGSVPSRYSWRFVRPSLSKSSAASTGLNGLRNAR